MLSIANARPVVWRNPVLWVGLAVAACLLWSYWLTITELIAFWQGNQDYSVGMLVFPVAICLAWSRRRQLSRELWQPALWGLAALILSQVARFAAVYYGYTAGERLSIVLTIGSLVLLIGGWTVFRRLIWIQVFLLLMVPFPNRLHNFISPPLQAWATNLGRFGLELLGFFVRQDGNVLHVEERTTVAVAEACSGLRMLTAFVVTAAVLCLLVKRPPWQKVVLLATSVPVAVVCNGIRVWATSLFMYYADDPGLEERFHDIAGLLMMPLAVAILVAELKFLATIAAPRSPEPASHAVASSGSSAPRS